MQCLYDASQSLDDYLSQEGWKRAPRPEVCPVPGCGKADCLTGNGFYGRFFGRAWGWIRRWLCGTTGQTVSMLPSWLGSHVGEALGTIEAATTALDGGSTGREAAAAAGLPEGDASRQKVRRWYRQVTDALGELRGALGVAVRGGEGLLAAFRRECLGGDASRRCTVDLASATGELFGRIRGRAVVRLAGVLFGPLGLYRGAAMRDGEKSTRPHTFTRGPSSGAVAERKLRPPGVLGGEAAESIRGGPRR